MFKLKKLVILISALSIIIYLSLWAWAVRWIDQDKDVADFMTEKKHLTLEIAKFVWKITPALEREKDAERLLKISKLSLFSDLKPYWNHNIENFKKNYKLVSEYQKKHKDELSVDFDKKFFWQKLILINRSLGKIKDDDFNKSFKEFVARRIDRRKYPSIMEHVKNNYGPSYINLLEHDLMFYPEILWFSFWNENVDKNSYVEYWKGFVEIINDINKEKNTEAYGVISQYHWANMGCYTNKIDHSKKSKEVFKIMQSQMIENNDYYKILSWYFDNEPSFILIILHLTISSKSECSKEAENFLSKMEPMGTILDKNKNGVHW